MMQGISPRFITDLIYQINEELSNKEKNTRRYGYTENFFTEWQKAYKKETGQDFEICYFYAYGHGDNDHCFDCIQTLRNMEHELLFKIAVDLGIKIPGLIFTIAKITNMTQPTRQAFEDACKEVYEKPAHAVIEVNAALEKLIKNICEDKRINNCSQSDKPKALLEHILKEFQISQDKKLNVTLRNITSGLITATGAIQEIRDFHTKSHESSDDKQIVKISDPLVAAFVVNACATIGLFLQGYYEKNYPKLLVEVTDDSDDSDDDIPF
jgi:hypothetical protein